ncbi:TrbI F-type domain-containing protein [Croceicoccus bisphenolivorans]|uniref:TrbI F-type domain-containing protein n=1 Tax=Croceicoccus bisphenolivorans TaxID=1783232 RepID=UPI0008358431|nr:TrbI F-type domain-containing protein [Croceicoccus bisphenolivorans]
MTTSLIPSGARRQLFGVPLASLGLGVLLLAALLWGAWATRTLLALQSREVVTVELSGLIGAFVEAEARSGADPTASQRRVAAYLQAIDASVDALGRDGRTVLVGEAVLAGQARDMTPIVRADVARRMEALAHAAR